MVWNRKIKNIFYYYHSLSLFFEQPDERMENMMVNEHCSRQRSDEMFLEIDCHHCSSTLIKFHH